MKVSIPTHDWLAAGALALAFAAGFAHGLLTVATLLLLAIAMAAVAIAAAEATGPEDGEKDKT